MDIREIIELLLVGEMHDELFLVINDEGFDFEVERNNTTGDFRLIADTAGYELVDSQDYEEMKSDIEDLKNEVSDLKDEIEVLEDEIAKYEE